MRHQLRAIAATVAGAAVIACGNAGEDRILSLSATGTLQGFVFLDQDGNLFAQAGVDDSLAQVRVRLLALNGGDTIATGTTLANGVFTLDNVPVGTYRIDVDTATVGDTVEVAKLDSTQVTLLPAETSVVNVAITYPRLTIAQARAQPLIPARRVFIVGIALNAFDGSTSTSTFSDTTVHVQDTSAAIRLARIFPTFLAPGDSVRFRGTVASRDGQPTLENVRAFPLGQTFVPTALPMSTVLAATANGGTRDARAVLITNATISDTAAVAGGWRLTVDDGSGALEVYLDPAASPQFTTANARATYLVGDKYNVVGLLTPTSTLGVWRLRPRSPQDLVLQP